MSKNKRHLFLLLLVIFVFGGLLNFQQRHANDFPYASYASTRENFDFPRLWSPDSSALGEYVVSTLWSWPLDILYGFGTRLGLNFAVLNRILGVIPIILIGVYSIGKLLKDLKISGSGVIVGSILYLLNTYMLLIVDGGQLSIGLAYALFPVTYYLITKVITGGWWNKVISAVVVVMMGFFDPRFIYILGILLLIYFAVYGFLENKQNILKWFWGWAKTGFTVILLYACLNIYWIFPSILVKAPMLPQGYAQVGQTSFLGFTNWKHAALLLQPQWYKNVFGVVPPINYSFILIPMLAFLMPLMMVMAWGKRTIVSLSFRIDALKLKIKNSKVKTTTKNLKVENIYNDKILDNIKMTNRKSIAFWSVVALIGIFLTKGSNPPFGGVYNFLFTNVPGFSLFRDSTKFFFLVALSYSVLIAYSVDYLTKKINLAFEIGNLKFRLVPILLISYFLFLVSPVWTGKMTGMFSKPVYEKESFAVSDMIENDDSFSRTFFIPSRAPLGYTSPSHPSVEALRLVSKRPFAIGVVGKYEQFNFLRESPFMGELFAVAGIKYIYYPYPDTRRETLKQDNIDYYYSFLDQLSNLPWVEKSISEPPVAVLETKKTKDHMFLANNSFYVVGSDRIYWELMGVEGFDLSGNAMLFAEENTGLINDIDPASKILVYEKNETDLLMSFVDEKSMYFPASELGRDPSASSGQGRLEDGNEEWPAGRSLGEEWPAGRSLGEGWWKRESSDLVWWKDFLQTKYDLYNLDFDFGGGWAVGEGDSQLLIVNDQLLKGNNLFVRVMKSNRSGKIEFWQGKEKIGEVVTQNRDPDNVEVSLTGYKEIPDQIFEFKKADFNWYEVGKIINNEPLVIKTFGEINVVNALASVSDDEGMRIKSQVKEMTDKGRVLVWEDLTDIQKNEIFTSLGESTITYKRINPTEYKVDIQKLDEPAFLVFSETFDKLWELNGQSSMPVYSLLNGFYVDKPGSYTLYFTPQEYVLPGLIVSAVSLFIILGYLIYPKFKKKI